jgi:single-stranded DNA-binding protein
MNYSMFTGTIARDWSVRGKTAGTSLLVRRKGKAQDGQPDADFVPIKVLGEKTVDFVIAHFPKKKWAEVTGHYQTFDYEKDGQKVYGHEFIVDDINFVGPKVSDSADGETSSDTGRSSRRQNASTAHENDDDVPF